MLLNGDTPVAVAEACSGLRMLTAFVVVAAFMAFVLRRPAWQRIALVASSVPIAIVCNLVRLVATAELFVLVSSDIGERFFHDFAGLTMMPLAVLMLVGELWLFSVLVEDPRRVASTSV
jgi:exosortase